MKSTFRCLLVMCMLYSARVAVAQESPSRGEMVLVPHGSGMSNCYSLLVPTTKLVWSMMRPVRETDQIKKLMCTLVTLLSANPCDKHRKFHVLVRGEYGNQIVELEDVSNRISAYLPKSTL